MLSEIEEFVEFMCAILKANTELSNQNAMAHSATRDTLQRVQDQLPAILSDFHAKKAAPVVDSEAVPAAVEGEALPVEGESPSSVA